MKHVSVTLALEKEHYYPGEVIKGTLTVDVDKPIKARSVQVWIEGKEHAVITRQETVYHHDDEHGATSSTETLVYSEDKWIVEGGYDLWVPEGQRIHGPSHKQFSFEFSLPPDALPTLSERFDYVLPDAVISRGISHTIPEKVGNTITYKVKAKIDKPFAADPNHEAELIVRRVSQSMEIKELSTKGASASGNTEVEFHIDKNTILLGENITGNVVLKTSPREKVRGVSIILGFCYSCTAQKETDVYDQMIDQISFPVDLANERVAWDFCLASVPGLPCTLEGDLVKIEWFVELKVDLPIKTDLHVRLPLRAINQ